MSNGEVVDISEDKIINLDTMQTEIQDTIAYTREFADNMQITLGQALEDLQATVGAYNPNLIDVDTSIAELDRPVFPTAPVFNDYSSDIRDALISRVLENLADGSTGISDAAHASIAAREQETRRTSQDEKYRAALDSVGVTNFNLPSGQVGALQAKVASESLKLDQDALNTLTVKDFELAQNNSQFAVTSGASVEATLVSTWAQEENTKVSVYNANIQGVVGEYDALAKWATTEIDRIKVEADIAIKNEELSLDAYNSMSSLAEKVSEGIAGIASQSIASALGAINTSLSNSYSGSEGRNEGWSHGDSLSEAHSYEHDPDA